jgi:deoxyribodipyrimidine photo-lyase
MHPAVRYAQTMNTLVWFRQDLRLADNPALHAALASKSVIPVYIWAPEEEGAWPPGGASRWWLHHSLAQLELSLHERGSRLTLRRGADSLRVLLDLARECKATQVLWNRRYEPAIIARDTAIRTALSGAGIESKSFNASLLHEPWTVKNKSELPFQVFTPFWRHVTALADPPAPLPVPASIPSPPRWPTTVPLEALDLLPKLDWAAGFTRAWTPGPPSAHAQLQRFLQQSFDEYPTLRDRPDVRGTSRMSPHLHFGEISPREIWHAVRAFGLERGQHTTWRDSQFLTEVGWREFAYHLLYHYPQTPWQPLRAPYAAFPWRNDPEALRAWQRGHTGYPIVDAGLRQLWSTGWMHNRVRMIVGSFLVKDLLLPWTDGAQWFWDTLVDADLASNTLGWQWVAGCGADAAPYFRIFNPVTQATRFDPDGAYIRAWVPELARLGSDWIHQPWAAPHKVLEDAGVTLGTSYPERLVDHSVARARALQALAQIRTQPKG